MSTVEHANLTTEAKIAKTNKQIKNITIYSCYFINVIT